MWMLCISDLFAHGLNGRTARLMMQLISDNKIEMMHQSKKIHLTVPVMLLV